VRAAKRARNSGQETHKTREMERELNNNKKVLKKKKHVPVPKRRRKNLCKLRIAIAAGVFLYGGTGAVAHYGHSVSYNHRSCLVGRSGRLSLGQMEGNSIATPGTWPSEVDGKGRRKLKRVTPQIHSRKAKGEKEKKKGKKKE
jgi:hypothetical protein